MTAMELLTIPGLDNSKKLENVRKDSMEKAVSNLARMKRARISASKAQDIERYGLRLELEQIQARYEEGDLCRSSYKRLRENVALMQVDLEDNV